MVDSCPVCAYPKSKSYSTQKWADQGMEYCLLVCENCDSAHSSPPPTDERLQSLYSSSFDYQWYQDHYDAKLQDCRIRVKEYRPLLGSSVMDFGGGMGYFSQAVREVGLDSVTYDPYVTAAPPQKKAWDCVVALHVLEHSNDLERTLSEIKEFLVPGGKIVLAVPNFESSGYRDQGMRWVWAQPPLIHIFHFTAAGLTALLERNGFENVQISYHERWDANHHADVLHAEHFRRWDAAWGLRWFRAIPSYRKLIAAINSRRRYRALRKSMGTPTKDRAELQVCATFSVK